MKRNKTIISITIILLIILLSVASFGGIYKLKDYKIKNVVPEFILGMELKEVRLLKLDVNNDVEKTIYDKDGNIVVDDGETEYSEEDGYIVKEEKLNSEDKLIKENYKKSKSILNNRLKKLGIDQYNISLNKESGSIEIKIPENEKTDEIIDQLLKSGTFELKDDETQEVLIDTNSVKTAKVVYGQAEKGTAVYLQIELNKDGTKKLEEISKIYVETVKEEVDENENEETKEATEAEESETEIKYVDLVLSGENVTKTYFGDTLTNGILNVQIGKANDSEGLRQYIKEANNQAAILNSGIIPIEYLETDEVISFNISKDKVNIGMYIVVGILLLMFVFLIIKFKLRGIFVGFLQIGYLATLLLVIRYTNVKLTISGIAGLVIFTIINFIYICLLFKNKEFTSVTKKYSLKLIPLFAIAIVLTFMKSAYLYSLGMTLVWGTIVMYIYNLTLTNIVLKTFEDEQK